MDDQLLLIVGWILDNFVGKKVEAVDFNYLLKEEDDVLLILVDRNVGVNDFVTFEIFKENDFVIVKEEIVQVITDAEILP